MSCVGGAYWGKLLLVCGGHYLFDGFELHKHWKHKRSWNELHLRVPMRGLRYVSGNSKSWGRTAACVGGGGQVSGCCSCDGLSYTNNGNTTLSRMLCVGECT